MKKFQDSYWIGKEECVSVNSQDILTSLLQKKDQIHVQEGTILLRKVFSITKEVNKAIIKVTGLGLYQTKINGYSIDDTVLSPITTDFRKIILYKEYDVTSLVRSGRNCVTIEVGSGWYSGKKKYWGWRMYWLGNPMADLRLDISFKDGGSQVVVSDKTWRVYDGPVTYCCIYDGEIFDKRLQNEEWDDPNYEDTEIDNAVCMNEPGGELVLNESPDIKVCDTTDPIHEYVVSETTYVYDFGKNCAGWVLVHVQGKRGDSIQITYAEQIFEDYQLNPESNRNARNIDSYILGSDRMEIYEPRFTYHGFRYVQIKKSSSDSVISLVKQRHVHSALKTIGYFMCDNPKIQKIHDACVLTEKNALQGLPLDCVQRDERLGWLGDAWVTSNTCIYNFDMNLFYRRWLEDIRQASTKEGDIPCIVPQPQSNETGSPEFSSGYLVILLNHYQFWGEKDIIEYHYDTVKRYVDYLLLKSDHFILEKGRYGDWQSIVSGFVRGDPSYCTTIFLYMDLIILIKFSQILGNKEDEEKYQKLSMNMRDILMKRFYNDKTHQFGDGNQFSTAFSLLLKLVPESDESIVLHQLIHDITGNGVHLSTGIFGTLFVLEVLRIYKKKDVFINLLLEEKYPGWLDMLKENTTLTETWDGKHLSRNHCMFGSVDSYYYTFLSGIYINHMSDDLLTIEPLFFKQINELRCDLLTKYGEIKVDWKRDNVGITLYVHIPSQLKYKLILPKEFEEVEAGIWKKYS